MQVRTIAHAAHAIIGWAMHQLAILLLKREGPRDDGPVVSGLAVPEAEAVPATAPLEPVPAPAPAPEDVPVPGPVPEAKPALDEAVAEAPPASPAPSTVPHKAPGAKVEAAKHPHPHKEHPAKVDTSTHEEDRIPVFTTLHDLLLNIESAMHALQVDYDSMSNLSEHDIRDLKKTGVTVCPWTWHNTDDDVRLGTGDARTRDYPVAIENVNYLPATIFMGGGNDYEDKDLTVWAVPEFFFAQRMPSFPWFVRKPPEGHTLYAIGIGYRHKWDGPATRKKEKVWWLGIFCAIDKVTGDIKLMDFMRRENVYVGKHRHHYTRAVWRTNTMCASAEVKALPMQAQKNQTKAFIAMMFDTMNKYKNEWSVTVRTSHHRVVMCVESSKVKTFFSKRDIEAGHAKRQPIFHIVGEHERIGKNGKSHHVREHSRGARHFTWRGFDCNIASPRFHVAAPGFFDVPPVDKRTVKDGRALLDMAETFERVNDFTDHAPRRALDGVEELKGVYH
jgi:hypothetical protein